MCSNPPRAPSLPSPVPPSCLPRLLLARLRQPVASLARPVPSFSPPRAQAGDAPDHARGSAAAIAAAERQQPPPCAAESTSPSIPLGPAATRQQIREAIFASGGRPTQPSNRRRRPRQPLGRPRQRLRPSGGVRQRRQRALSAAKRCRAALRLQPRERAWADSARRCGARDVDDRCSRACRCWARQPRPPREVSVHVVSLYCVLSLVLSHPCRCACMMRFHAVARSVRRTSSL